jgi:excisionase family DNA binding protein
MNKEWYSVEELATLLQLHPKTVQRFIREGRIQGSKLGRSWKVHRDALKAFSHAELATEPTIDPDAEAPGRAVRVSAVIEVPGQGPEAAARIARNIMGALASPDAARGSAGFSFGYHEGSRTARYTFTGQPDFIARIMALFGTIQDAIEGADET